ncbi:MAG: tail fiber assembly protein [Plesiomonas sp.]|uniref:tail fiber assembly protein n=1 Tax=Plesiomonas sp. TaxID=2486279 RepID=UPI003F347B09
MEKGSDMKKNTYIWSAKNISFFPVANISDYKNSGWDVSDVIDIDDAVFDTYKNAPQNGKKLGVDNAGMPAWVDIPPLTNDELVQLADEKKQRLISYASNVINANMWQTKLQLGRITSDEKRQLNLWLDYIDAVNAIDTSTAPDINWPVLPEL